LLKIKDLIRKREREPKAEKSSNEVYIYEVVDYKRLKNKSVVVFDRIINDLIYCVNSNEHDQVKFRYTLGTHHKEAKVKSTAIIHKCASKKWLIENAC